MDTKKDIGQFFNDRLNQMEFTPNENGWNKIEEELNEKKRKKRAFFWMFFGAFLSGSLLTLLLVYSTNLFLSDSENIKNQNSTKTIGNTTREFKTEDSNKNSNYNSNENKLKKGNTETTVSNKNNLTNENTEFNPIHKNSKNGVVSIDNKFEGNTFSNTSKLNKINRTNSNSKEYKKENFNTSSNNKFSKTKRKNKSNSIQKATSLAFYKKVNQKDNNSKIDHLNSNNLKTTNITSSEENAATENGIKNDSTKIVLVKIEAKDSTSLALVRKKSAKKSEKILEKDSTEVVTKKNTNTFILSPYFGYGLLNKNQVTGNFKATNNVTVSNEHYGIMFRWMTSKKYGLQIGLGYLNMSTKTEIEKTNSNSLSFNDVENNSNVTFPPSNKLLMTHDLSMYEIPLEFYYNFNDKKLGFAIASGISHTIIKDNDVYIESPTEKTKIGRLQTISNQSFSANLKAYSFYKISDKIQFELYPSFQYQFLNSLKNKDLNPYILSIRAGISYQF